MDTSGGPSLPQVVWLGMDAASVHGTQVDESPAGVTQGATATIRDNFFTEDLAANSSATGVFEPLPRDESREIVSNLGPSSSYVADSPPSLPRNHIVVDLPKSTLNKPRSSFDGFIPSSPQVSERHAVTALLGHVGNAESADDFIELELSDFSIYVDSKYYPEELRPLQHLSTRAAADRFYFDGVLSAPGHHEAYFVRKVPFRSLPIGNYGLSEHTVGHQIWIRSERHCDQEIYYKLSGRPSTEYERFHEPFLWIVDLAKHVVDYCEHQRFQRKRIMLQDFQSRFKIFLYREHSGSPAFEQWAEAHKTDDFRSVVATNIDFIWKEAVGVLGQKDTDFHCFWKEIRGDYYAPNLSTNQVAHKPKEIDGNEAAIPETVVTPYVHHLFHHMPFGDVLKPTTPADQVLKSQSGPRWVPPTHPKAFQALSAIKADTIASIKPGDVISTKPDDPDTGTQWKLEASSHHTGDDIWYGLVQKVHPGTCFDVIWLYQPRDTPCAVMKYPWPTELFLSDHCNCDGAKVDGEDVLGVHDVQWFGSPTHAQLFVRQTYLTINNRNCWISLQSEHMYCHHRAKIPLKKYRRGDTVLADAKRDHLEVFEVDVIFREGRKRIARLRRLLRRREVDSSCAACPKNELVYTNQFLEMRTTRIIRKCLVRVFRYDEEEKCPYEWISAPYDRGGTGDAYFITHEQVVDSNGRTQYVPLSEDAKSSLRQGFNPNQSLADGHKLRGLDLFCGGGNFGRGLEDGGGIEMMWANDISANAIHTYMANSKPGCKPFLGSVDDLLDHALRGDSVPRPGEIHFISGGSPCQGFSTLTNNKQTKRQRKNQSLIASFASFVDLYRPHYGLLENVASIVQVDRSNCYFSQLVCSIVGLGYQVQILSLDAWSYGSSQSRTRLFLLFTAPGLKIPEPPSPSHSHPEEIFKRDYGRMSNGLSFVNRPFSLTPFEFVSAQEAVGDLPPLYDGMADFCVGFPDHRLSVGFTPRLRYQLQRIPTQPWGMNFSKSFYNPGKAMLPGDIDLFLSKNGTGMTHRLAVSSKGWGRVNPKGLFPTITTVCAMTDARTGAISHWKEPRPLSLLEARRAQGFLDHEVILGSKDKQWHIVGNSVDRKVAMVLGLAIREAWFGTLWDDGNSPPTAQPSWEVTTAVEPDRSRTTTMTLSDDDEVFTETPKATETTPLTPATSLGDLEEATTTSSTRYTGKRPGSIARDLLVKRHRHG